MTQMQSDSRRTALRALWLVLASAIIAWAVFLIGQYLDLAQSDPVTAEVSPPEQAHFMPLFSFAAIAVFGACALVAKRRLAASLGGPTPPSSLAAPVSGLASTSIIIAAALSAWAVFMLFFSGFFESSDPQPVARLVNLYLPIALYTVLVVALILMGFVFDPSKTHRAAAEPQLHAPEGSHPAAAAGAPGAPAPAPASAAPAPASAASAPPASSAVVDAPQQPAPAAAAMPTQRATALGYAIPIIAAAIALVLGLIVYDITRTSLQSWIWVAILAIIAGGVYAGTVYARRGEGPHTPAAAGAKILNLILSIFFAVVVAGMSLGYGSSAVHGLRVAPDLSISFYSDHGPSEPPTGGPAAYTDPQISLWGSDLRPNSEATITAEPGGTEVVSATVDRDRWLSGEASLPDSLTAGEYELVAQATSVDGRPLEVSLPVTIGDDGTATFPSEGDANLGDGASRLLPITPKWIFDDVLPAGLMLVLGTLLIATTLTSRNRDGQAA